MIPCPAVEQLERLLEAGPGAEDSDLVPHIESCPSCQQRLEDLTRGFSSLRGRHEPTSADLSPAPPSAGGVALAARPEHTGDYTPASDLGAPAAPADPDQAVAPDVPGYRILARLGCGGMGVVYRATQERLNRPVALKMLVAGAAASEEQLQRFRIEAEAVARLHHPHIVQIHEVGVAGGLPFFALELLDGGSLEGRLGGEPQAARPAAELLTTLARAVHAAHQAGIVHRDLKPANVLFTADGTPKVTDFGLAKRLEEAAEGHTRTGQVMGSPGYMAPEQARGRSRAVGPAADVYALGVILYEMLTGRVPLKGTTTLETLLLTISGEPVPPRRLQPGVPRDLETVCLKCLHKEPEKRYHSAGHLADDLDRFLHGRPILARPTPWWERAWKWARRHPAAALAFAFFTTLAAAAGAGGWWYYQRTQDETRRAEEERREDADRLARRRDEGQGQLFDGQEALRRGDNPGAIRALSNLITRLGDEPRLDDLRRRAADLLAQAERADAGERARRADQARYDRFQHLRDESLRYDAGFTGLDSPESLTATRSAARAALDIVSSPGRHPPRGVSPPRQQGPLLARRANGSLPAALPKEDQDRVAEGRYEMLLVLAGALAQPLKGEDGRAQAREALAALDEAARLRPGTRAYFLRRAACLDALGDRGGAAQARVEAGRVPPVSAFDHFLSGQERYRSKDLAGAATAFAAAVGLRPDHFWAHYLLALCHLRARPARLGGGLGWGRRSGHGSPPRSDGVDFG